jgi:hypothetical protein
MALAGSKSAACGQPREWSNCVSDYEINCINKPDRAGSVERIQYIGNSEGQWKLSLDTAVACIQRGDTFHTLDRTTGRRVDIFIVDRKDGSKPFLQTYADGKWNDNLLAQPECANCRIL